MKTPLFIILVCLSVFLNFQLSAQNRTVKGNLKNMNGRKISEAVVFVKGTKKYAVTDKEGNFVIKAHSNDVLIFSATGYHLAEFKVGNNTKINTQLVSIQPLMPEELPFYEYKITQKQFWSGATKSFVDLVVKEYNDISDKVENLIFGKSKAQLSDSK